MALSNELKTKPKDNPMVIYQDDNTHANLRVNSIVQGKDATRLISDIQRLACLNAMEAKQTAPITALEVFLDIEPLHSSVKEEARITRHKLMQGHATVSCRMYTVLSYIMYTM